MANIKAVLYDLDGTILDTNELIFRSFMYALQGVVADEFGREHIIPSMGQPLVDQLRLFSGQEDVAELLKKYRVYNLSHHDEFVKPFPYVNEVLAKLEQHGILQGVVTSKMRMTTERGLRYVGIMSHIHPSAIMSIDDVVHPKPHPEAIVKAIESLSVLPEETIMLGDSAVDMQAAVAAGCIPVGVAWSLKEVQLLLDHGAQHIIHDMRDLYTIIGVE